MAEALVIGGWFASAAVSKLYDSIRSFISGRYHMATGVKSKLQSLERSVGKIKAVIGAIERKGVTEDPNVVSWLNDLKDAVYDAEDVLDFFNYQTLRRSVEANGSEGRSSFLVSVSCKFVKKAQVRAKRFFFPDDSLHLLSDVVQKFDRLADDGQIGTFLKVIELNTDSSRENESFERRQTTPVPAEPEVFGRSREKDGLLKSVLVSSDKNGSNGKNFSVVSIVGIGGVGKTTLAQWLYNHPHVKKQFNLMAWVCVSDRFNMRRVMIEIIESAYGPRNQNLYNCINFGSIHEDLSKLLCEKRFLIVLDDVWDGMVSQWDKLISLFRCGKDGSKIVISTRNRIVADKVNSMGTIYLTGLEDEEYWQFFIYCAFGDVNPKDHPKLEHIGKQIASKLGGLPLAAKVVGGVLKLRLEERYWRDVLENKGWQEEGTILPSLRLSYNHLPGYLKQCFVYCALFPKDYRFNIDKLVNLWVAQGYVQSSCGTKTLEDVGLQYFNELYCRSFFQHSSSDWYVIHDLLHDLAESILADEIYREENGSSVKLKIPNRVRHLFVSSTNLDRVLDQIKEPKKLRSLVYNPPHQSSILPTSHLDFKKLRGLRVLIIGVYYSPSHLETIGHMLQLRYLEFPLGTKLPISLGKLFNLLVLQLTGCLWIDNLQLLDIPLSEIFGKLTNLRYINAPDRLVSAIPSIGKLTSLQKLTYYKVKQEEGHRICELRNLNEIQGCLCIDQLKNVANKEEAKKAQLHNKLGLEELSLCWSSYHSSNVEIRVHDEVLEGLQPHSKIKRIYISGYMGLKHPSWLNKSYLSNIESISLIKWGCFKVLPPLGELPFLKFLFLDSLMSLEMIGLEAHGCGVKIFPSLLHLKLHNLKELREWSGFKEDVFDMIPLLSKLEITSCYKLKALPPLGGLQCLNDLHLSELNSLTKIGTETYGRESVVFPKLKYLLLSSIKELKEWLAPDDGQSLMPHLTNLNIINCPNLKVIPPLGELPCLEFLHLGELDSLEEIGIEIYGQKSIAFPSLECLKLSNMRGLTKWCVVEEQGQVLMPCLRELEIFSCHKLEFLYLSSIKEQWLSSNDSRSLLLYLTDLNITNCRSLKVIPRLGELLSLKCLRLRGLDSLEEIGIEIYGRKNIAFPSLEYLELSDMSRLTKWCAVEEQGQVLMPCLRELNIINCLKLRRPINYSSSLEVLKFGFSENVDYVQMFHELFPVCSLTCLKKLTLGPWKGLESFTEAEQEWFQSLTSLRELSFYDCSNLQRLPDVSGSFCCLERLKLSYCCDMVSLGQNNLPKNLKELQVRGCRELRRLCDWRQAGSEWNKISHIPLIRIENEVIPHPAPLQCSRSN